MSDEYQIQKLKPKTLSQKWKIRVNDFLVGMDVYRANLYAYLLAGKPRGVLDEEPILT